ncbi:MAG: hypothetical protein HY934_04310 [Candidatus Firestonebacteria bacterium]|nr:hypothetical protein [Candidatus Firestonebacteria bacterium]
MNKKASIIIFIILWMSCSSVFSQEAYDPLILSEAARSTNYLSKLFAMDLLGDIADDSYRNFFILALNNEKDTWIRYYAALALSNLKIDEQILFELKKLLTDKLNEPWLRKKIAEILYSKTGEKFRYRDEKDAIVLYVTDVPKKINK